MAAKAKATKKPARKAVGEATYTIDDRGGMHINDGQQTIKIERDDVRRLKLFLDVHART